MVMLSSSISTETMLFLIILLYSVSFVLSTTSNLPSNNIEVLYDFQLRLKNSLCGVIQTKEDPNIFLSATTLGGDFDLGALYQYNVITQEITVLHHFTNNDGQYPVGEFYYSSSGLYFGVTAGELHNIPAPILTYGTIYTWNQTSKVITKLYTFTGEYDGSSPHQPPIEALDGYYYGLTVDGVLYRLDPYNNFAFSVAYTFNQMQPPASQKLLLNTTSGVLLGTAQSTYGMKKQQDSNRKLHSIDIGPSVGPIIFGYNPVTGNMSTLYNLPTSCDNPSGNIIFGIYGEILGTCAESDGILYSINGTANITVIHRFNSSIASIPKGSIVQLSDGRIFGITSKGGPTNGGVIYLLNPYNNQTFTVIQQFATDANLEVGFSAMTINNDMLYSVAYGTGVYGFGYLFSVNTSNYIVSSLYDFSGNILGANPQSSLTLISNNGVTDTFLATCVNGGLNDGGTLFNITTDGTMGVIYQFDPAQFAHPESGVILGSDGFYYGTTFNPAAVYKYDLINSTVTLIHLLTNLEGIEIIGGLVQSSVDMNYYGLASGGGQYGVGTIFQITSTYPQQFSVVYHFTGTTTDGAVPLANLIESSDGSLYGTCSKGGMLGFGTIFRIDFNPAFELFKVHDFTGNDGSSPSAALFEYSGFLYSTTYTGGISNLGVIYKFSLIAINQVTVLYSFDDNTGANPSAGLTLGSDGLFYGVTAGGCDFHIGCLFRLNITSNSLDVLLSLDQYTFGNLPLAPLLEYSPGKFIMPTYHGGNGNTGVVLNFETRAYFPVIGLAAQVQQPLFTVGQQYVVLNPDITGFELVTSQYMNFNGLRMSTPSGFLTISTIQLLTTTYNWMSTNIDLASVSGTGSNSLTLYLNRTLLVLGSTITLNFTIIIPAIVTFVEAGTAPLQITYSIASYSIIVSVPGRPVSNSLYPLLITPNSGLATVQPFNLSLQGFFDTSNASFPLFYGFSYIDLSNPSITIQITGTLSHIPYVITYFPIGNFLIEGFVYTQLGAFTVLNQTISAYFKNITNNNNNNHSSSASTSTIITTFACDGLNITLNRLIEDQFNHNYNSILQDLQIIISSMNFSVLSSISDMEYIKLTSYPYFSTSAEFESNCLSTADPYELIVFTSALQVFLLRALNSTVEIPGVFNIISPSQVSQLLNEMTINLQSTLTLINTYLTQHAANAPDLVVDEVLSIVSTIIAQLSQLNALQLNDPDLIGQNLALGLSSLLSPSTCSLLPAITSILTTLITSTNNNAQFIDNSVTQYKTSQLNILFKRVSLSVLLNTGAVIPNISDSSIGSSFSFPLQAIANLTNSSIIDIVAIQQTQALGNCFTGNNNTLSAGDNTQVNSAYNGGSGTCTNGVSLTGGNPILVTDVYDVLVLDSLGRIIPVQNLSDPTVLGLPVNNNTISASNIDPSRLSCQYYDTVAHIWRTDGCQLIINPDNSYGCSCNHLTPFALLYYTTEPCSSGFTYGERVVFSVFAALYAVLFVFTAIQLVRLYKAVSTSKLLLYQHALLFALCFIRGLGLLANALPTGTAFSAANWSIIVNGVITLIIPFALFFACFTLLIFSWMSIYHYSMSHPQNATDQLKLPLYIVNIAVSGTLLVLLIIIGAIDTSDSSLQQTVIIVGTAIMALATILVAVAFAVYGTLLCRQLTRIRNKLTPSQPTVNKGSSGSGSGSSNTSGSSSALQKKVEKMFIVAQLLGISLTLVAVLQFVTAFTVSDFYDHMKVFTTFSYGADCFAIILMLILFEQGVANATQNPSNVRIKSEQEERNITKTSAFGEISKNSRSRNISKNTRPSVGGEPITGIANTEDIAPVITSASQLQPVSFYDYSVSSPDNSKRNTLDVGYTPSSYPDSNINIRVHAGSLFSTQESASEAQ